LATGQTLKIDINSLNNLQTGITKSIQKGIDEGLNAPKTKEKIDKIFSLKGMKQGLASSFKEGMTGTDKMKTKQAAMSKILSKNAGLSKAFTGAVAGGAGKAKILSTGLKLAQNYGLGMLKNMNPYVAALKVAVELSKQFAKYYQQTLENSSKFISQGSLFTDRKTMDMMQRTGQSASGAQGTNRSLDRLGISFEDIQTGKVTKAQMKAFEDIRKEETKRLEEIQRVGGPVFEAMQRGALAMARTKQIVTDTMTLAFAKSKGVMVFATRLKEMFDTASGFVATLGSVLNPIINIVSGVLAGVIKIVNIVMKVVDSVFTALKPVFDTVTEIVDVVITIVDSVLEIVDRVVSSVLKPVTKALSNIFAMIMAPIRVVVKVISGIIDMVMEIVTPILDVINLVFDIFADMIPVFSAFEKMQPVLNIITTTLKIIGAAIGWVIRKIGQGIAWVWGKVSEFIDNALNAIPKAISNVIGWFIELYNDTLGVLLGKIDEQDAYQGFSINDLISNLQGGLDNTLASIQGDTFNYNTTTSTPVAEVANVNLFNNQYVIVND
jgi:hypothetical protein